MGDVVTRFRLETTQFDSALRDASKSLSAVANDAKKAGADFEGFTRENVEAARALGQTASGAVNARGKLNDLVGSFNDAVRAYNKLTQEQQQSDFGKALGESLEQLQARIKETKDEVYSLGDSTNNASGVLDRLKEKINVNVDAFKLFEIGLKAAEGALGVVKDAFFKNEQNLDEWGRTVKSCESLYGGFLSALNNGNISGYLSNIDEIVKAAREAYDALDELATFNAFNKANIAGARAGLSGAIADYREGTGGKDAVEKAANDLIKELETKQKLQAQAYDKVVADVARQRMVNPEDLLKVMTGDWGSFKELKDLEYTGSKTRIIPTGGTYATGPQYNTITEAVPANERERLAQAVKQLNDTEIDNFQSLAEAAKMTEVEINNQRKMVARILSQANKETTNTPTPTRTTRSTIAAKVNEAALAPQNSIAGLTEDLRYLQQEQQKATNTDEWRTYQEAIRAVNEEIKILKGELNGPMGLASASGTSISGAINKQVSDWEKQMGKKLSQGINTEKVSADGETKSISKTMSEVSGNMQTIVSGLETLGVDIPEGFSSVLKGMTAVASILSGISALVTILTAIQGTKAVPVIGWALARGGVVHAAGGYPVPGNNFSGDMVPALLNSGETVLNRAQTGLIASALQENRMSALRLEATVGAEQIRFVLNNNGRRTGRGEYVTTRFGRM